MPHRLPVARARVMHSHTPGTMNKTEEKYRDEILQPQKLIGEIAEWWFEGMSLKIGPKTRYIPDFVVQRKDGRIECHEVKGAKRNKQTGVTEPYYADANGRTKVSVAASQWPFRFVVTWRGDAVWQAKEVAGG